MKHEELTEKIIGCFYRVYNTLGYGFLEKVYENALAIEFRKAGMNFEKQIKFSVFYGDEVVGSYTADFVVEGKVIIEIKAIRCLDRSSECQLLNYLTATDKEVGLLLNFGEEAEVKRKVYDNGLKRYRGFGVGLER